MDLLLKVLFPFCLSPATWTLYFATHSHTWPGFTSTSCLLGITIDSRYLLTYRSLVSTYHSFILHWELYFISFLVSWLVPVEIFWVKTSRYWTSALMLFLVLLSFTYSLCRLWPRSLASCMLYLFTIFPFVVEAQLWEWTAFI